MKRLASLMFGLFLLIPLFSPSVLAQQADASLNFESTRTQANFGEEFTVDVEVSNPGNQSIIAVRSWLEYNSNALEVISLDTDMSPFTLAAPGEDKAEASENLIKIGRSNISGGETSSQALVTTIRFRVNTQSPMVTSIRPHNYQVDESGNTTVNIIDGGLPLNILSGTPETLFITLNGGGSVGGDPNPPAQNNNQNQNTNPLSRPQNVKLNVADSTAELRWDMGMEPELKGYFVYYGKTSGFYTRRMNVGLNNQAFFDELENGQIYYFAVTAYDHLDRETDYSDEVAGIIGQPGSSTAPFEDLLSLLLAQIPNQTETGPAAWWLLITSSGLAWLWVRRKKKLKIS